MIILTGDTHGDYYDITKILHDCVCLNEHDTLVILGDAGFNYYENTRDTFLKEVTKDINFNILCIHGNHEKRPNTIGTYKEKVWNDGIVYYEEEYPHLLFAKDGIFNIDNNRILVIGGAYSVDKFYRLKRGWKWFEDEQPSQEIKDYIETIVKENNEFDYVFTHTCPISYEPTEMFLSYVNQNEVDKSTEIWLEKIKNSIEYKHWYCGHYHTNKDIDNLSFLFHDYKIID